MALTKYNGATNTIQSLSDRPNQNEGLTAAQLKLKFDQEAINNKAFINNTLTVEIDDLDAENVKKTDDQTIDGVKTFIASPIVPTPTTDMQVSNKKYVDDNFTTKLDVTNNRKLSETGDFTGTLNGLPIVAADPGLSTTVAGHTTQLAEKANIDDVNDELALKADKTEVNSLANAKANQTDLTETNSRLTVQENKKISQTDCTPELIAQIAGTTAINATPADYSIVNRQFKYSMVIGTKSKNLFDLTDIVAGKFINSTNGNENTNASLSASNFVPIKSSTYYAISGTNQQYAFYNSSKVYISGVVNTTTPTQSPSNAAYIRISMLNTEISNVQIEEGNIKTTYESFNPRIDLSTIRDVIPETKLDSLLIRGTIKNLFNKATVTTGKLVYYLSGNLITQSGCNSSDYIPVLSNTNYKVSGTNQQGAFYDSSKVFISGLINMSAMTTTPVNCAYIKLTVLDSELNSVQIEKGTSVTAYENYAPRIEQTQIRNSGVARIITVKKDGTGDYTKVVDAVNYANLLNGQEVDINIYAGTYDLLSELGGQTWLDTIVHSGTFAERQGLRPNRNVNLIGVGKVTLTFRLPDTVTYVQSQCTSCLNLYQTNRIENIEFIAKNCRYSLHDETDNLQQFIERKLKRCTFTHEGNLAGLWEYPTAIGGGTGSGCNYDIVNCKIKANNYNALSYHTNSNQDPCYFNIDGCVCITGNSSKKSIRVSTYGTGQTGNSIANVKNCTVDGVILKEKETPESNDAMELYVNGTVTVAVGSIS